MKKSIIILSVVVAFAIGVYASTIMVDKNLSVLITKDQIIVLVERDASGKIVLEAPIKNARYNEVQIRTKQLQERVEK